MATDGPLVGALIGAVLAALGYVGKVLADQLLAWQATQRARQASLVRLQSLLLASRRVFELQAEQRNQLSAAFEAQQPALAGRPYDEVLAEGFAAATPAQKMQHGLIRQYTISAMRPLNKAMSDWLAADDYYKLARHSADLAKLALALRTLDAHLVLWHAKYDFWIADRPERALVYMADENAHGAGFPAGIDPLVERLAGGTQRD